MKIGFLFFFFFLQTIYQLCTNPNSDRSLLSCLKVTQFSTSGIGDAPLYKICSLPIQVMTTGSKLWQRCIAKNNRDASRVMKTKFPATVMILVWFQVRATPCHLTSSKSAGKSTPKSTCMCWRVWWSPGTIRWGVAEGLGAGPQVRRDPGLASEGVLRLCTFLSLDPLLPRPEPAGLLRLVIRREHQQHDLPQHQSQPDRPPSAEYSPSSRRRLMKRRLHWTDVSSTT